MNTTDNILKEMEEMEKMSKGRKSNPPKTPEELVSRYEQSRKDRGIPVPKEES